MPSKLFFGLVVLAVFYLVNLAGCQSAAQLQKDTSFARLGSLPPEVKFPENLKDKIHYDSDDERLTFKGAMSEAEKNELLKLSKDAQYTASIKELFKSSQTKKLASNSAEAVNNRISAPKEAPQTNQREAQIKAKPEEQAKGASPDEKHSRTVGACPEGQNAIKKAGALLLTPLDTTGGGDRDSIEEVAAEIVSRFTDVVLPTKTKDFNVLVKPFLTLDGRQTILSNLLVEELFTQLSQSQWAGNTLKICCNPTGGDTTFTRPDGIIAGSLVKIGREIKVNARLVAAETHIILSAVSTKIPVSESLVSLFETEIPIQHAVEGDDLNTRLDSLAWQVEQILHDLHGDKKGEQRICLLGFTTLEGDKKLLERFLAQECVLRFSKSKSWRVVPSARVKELLGREVSTISDLSNTELTDVFLRELGIDAVIDGMITDLGSSIKVNVRVSETTEGLTYGTASIEIERDKRIEYLLSKETGQILASARTPGPGETANVLKVTDSEKNYEQKNEEADTAGELSGVFLREDFSSPNVVNSLSEWGKNLIITSEGGKHFLASQEKEFVKIGRNINFPENFSLEFEVKGNGKYWNTLKFVDVVGNEFSLDFQFNGDNCFVVLPGPKSIKVKADTTLPNKLTLIRKDGFYEVYVNDNMVLAGPYSKYSLFKSFALIARLDQVRFTGFIGKAIRG